jgi:RHS repeat-associated protein
MKNINAIAGPLLALGFWLLDAQPAQCFYNQGACAPASTPVPEGAAIATPPVEREYGPFGEVIRATGPMAKANPLRFSTKYQNDETDLLYYGYRYYNASTGRWLSRDPINEPGCKALLAPKPGKLRLAEEENPYKFVNNNGVNAWDKLGKKCCLTTYQPSLPDESLGGHSALSCDNGVYISFSSPSHGGTWRTPTQDQDDFSQDPDVFCFDCLDESKVAAWLANARNGIGWDNDWTFGHNCADAVDAAAASALPQPQVKPKCPCSDDRFKRWVLADLLNEDPRAAGITLPSAAADRFKDLAANGCQRYKCVLKNAH